MSERNEKAATSAPLPPLYAVLEPLNAQRHGGLRLRSAGFGFARALSAVPLAAEEFPAAMRDLAIVFGTEAPHSPVALTALRAGGNAYVEEDGRWRPGCYLPAYLRRHPFFLARISPATAEMTLCLDPGAPQLSPSEGEALFDAQGKPTARATEAFDFARAAEAAFLRTAEMVAGLAELGLLGPATVEFRHDGKPFRVDGFHAVQRDKLAALDGAALVRLRDKGWLDAIYAHLHSLGAIAALAQRSP